jgi:hypothetical protein
MTENSLGRKLGTQPALEMSVRGGVQAMLWLRAMWLAMVLIVPGGFLVFVALALSRALLYRWRTARQVGEKPKLRQILASLRWSDVDRELRALANASGPKGRAQLT